MQPPPAHIRSASAGFTLIELLVALALFAMISLAGVSMITTTIGVQQQTDGRSERLAEVQRALFLMVADFEQLADGPYSDASSVSLVRSSSQGEYTVGYSLSGNALHRVAAGEDRIVLADVSGLEWQFYKDGGWTGQPVSKENPDRPLGVAVTLRLGQRIPLGTGGKVRRVLELPSQP